MSLSTFFVESPSTSKCPTIISSRSIGKGFSDAGETTMSEKEQAKKDKILEQNARRHY
jgi:hypothetical protein